MKIIIEEIDGMFYAEAVLSHEEIGDLYRSSKAINGEVIHRNRKCYVMVREESSWEEE